MTNNNGVAWRPVDLDGSPHRCSSSETKQQQQGNGHELRNERVAKLAQSISIEDRLLRLETAVFGIRAKEVGGGVTR